MLSDDEKKIINSLENEYKKLEKEGNILFPLYKQQAKTVLNLITKLQKENEILKRAFDKQTADMSNNLLELQQKDKQIDLMARAFKQDDVRSVEEIKQYFERKVEDENR